MVSGGGDPLVYPRVGRLRGTVARSTTWWGRAWVRTFEETALDGGDVLDARALARSGRLGAVVVLAGMASVAVDRGSPGEVVAQLRVTQLDDAAWEAFTAELTRESGFAAALESGELPAELVEHADQVGAELLPGAADLETACACDAWAQPCVHALALLQQLAWHLDEDPYALLLLRGRTREQLLGPPPPARTVQDDAAERAAEILRLAAGAPRGHGLADSAVAAYDEQVGRLL
jgi:uncharacterized Zn finger protein